MHTPDSEYEKRKKLTFAQAEGAEALPSQLKRSEITQRLRSAIWNLIYSNAGVSLNARSLVYTFNPPWNKIYFDFWVDCLHCFIDTYEANAKIYIDNTISKIFKYGSYLDIFSSLQFIICHSQCPNQFRNTLQDILTAQHAAFRIVNNDTFCPVGSEEDIATVSNAIDRTKERGLFGANKHLISAADAATKGLFADSVRESINAVESVARIFSDKGGLGGALAVLETKRVIHKAMKSGFCSLYGYASDEKGIRHPLLEEGEAAVNEADALFMLSGRPLSADCVEKLSR